MPRISKTHREWIVQGHYGACGWEDENTELTAADGRRSIREYRENGYPGASYRLIVRRVKNDELINGISAAHVRSVL